MNDINHLTKRCEQLKQLLEKSEDRAERLKTLNDQTKKQLELEREKNDKMQQENSALKQQVFQTHKELRDLQELFEIQKTKIENLQNEQQKKSDIKICQKCVHLAIKRTDDNVKQRQISPHLSQNMLQTIYSQNGNKNNGTIFEYNDTEERSPNNNNENYQSSSSSSQQQISDDDKNNSKKEKQKNMSISVRFNQGKGADYIKTISKSIVAIKYEGDYQDDSLNESQDSQNNNNDDIKSGNLNLKQVSSIQNVDEEKDQQQEQQDFMNKLIQQNNNDIQNQKDLNISQDLALSFNKKSSSKGSGQMKSQSIIKFNRVNSKKTSTIRPSKEIFEEVDKPAKNYQRLKSIVTFNNIKEKINNSNSQIQDKPNQKQVNFAEKIVNSNDIKENKQGTLNQITEEGSCQTTINNNGDSNTNVNNNSHNINVINLNKNENNSEIDSNNFNISNFNSCNFNSGNFNSKECDNKSNNDSGINSRNSTNNRLFEKFFILGCEKEDMYEFDQDVSTTQALLPGKILYSYPEINQDDHQDQVLKVIHEFAFPKGIKSKKIKISSSYRRIRKYVLSQKKTMFQSKFYMFTMKSDSSYTNSEAPQEGNSVVDTINPHRLMYCFCYKAKDYLETVNYNIKGR